MSFNRLFFPALFILFLQNASATVRLEEQKTFEEEKAVMVERMDEKLKNLDENSGSYKKMKNYRDCIERAGNEKDFQICYRM